MFGGASSPFLAKIRVHPIKSLDPVEIPESAIGRTGGLALDRLWALYAADGKWINGKRTAAIHAIRANFVPDFRFVDLSAGGQSAGVPPAQFAFPADTEAAAQWFSGYFGERVSVRFAEDGFPDDTLAPGPTIVSTASLETVCSWFPGISLEQARRRFRTNLEIGGVPPFWEDRLFADEPGKTVPFRIGSVLFEGSNPCARCAVPPRDPQTGIAIEDFQKRFTELRRQQLPPWSPAKRFDHFYRFAVNTRVPATEFGKVLHTGDPLTFE
jgi:MOSC domain-containing protein